MAKRLKLYPTKGVFETPLGLVFYTVNQWNYVTLEAATEPGRPALHFGGHAWYVSIGVERNAGHDWRPVHPPSQGFIIQDINSKRWASASTATEIANILAVAWKKFSADKESMFMVAELQVVDEGIAMIESDLARGLSNYPDEDKTLLKKLYARKKAAEKLEAKYYRQGGYPNEIDWDPR